MNFTIQTDNNLKIIIYRHSGNLSEDDIGMAWQEFLQTKEFTEESYNLLSDFSEATFNFNANKAYEIVDFFMAIKHILNGKKQAILVNNPHSTAASFLLQNETSIKTGFKIKVFSTEKAALKWLSV